MKRILELVKWNFMPVVMLIGLSLALSFPGFPYWVKLLIAFIIGYTTGLITFKFKPEQ
jgi:lipopolysaccharide export LptBFGC system permease protein LptF